MRHLQPIITTHALQECAEFYRRAFDARILFRADWYVHLSLDGWEIGFLQPNQPERLPVFQHTAPTRGLCIAVEVDDVRTMHQQLIARGIPPLGPLREFPGGELSFSVMDPAGVVLNIVERRADHADIVDI